jgi:TonB family protein
VGAVNIAGVLQMENCMFKGGMALGAVILAILCTTPAYAQSGATPVSPSNSSDADHANSAAGEWTADQTSGCKVWNDHPKLGETVRWSGDCMNGLATGNGTTQRFRNGKPGEKSTADYVDGRRSGKGVITYSNGNRYEGEFVENRQSGKGVFTWKNGNRYEGDFLHGKRTGKGVWTASDGQHYEGDFIDGKLNGKGVLTWANGDRYEGDFIDGKRTGKGVWTTANGEHYEGYFVDGQVASQEIFKGTNSEKGANGGFVQFQKSVGANIQDAINASAIDHAHLTNATSAKVLSNVGGFEFDSYVARFREIAGTNWHHLINSSGKDFKYRSGKTAVEFTVLRDGKIKNPEITTSSGQDDLDELALQSILLSDPAPALPKGLAKKEVRIRFTFQFIGAKEPFWKKK